MTTTSPRSDAPAPPREKKSAAPAETRTANSATCESITTTKGAGFKHELPQFLRDLIASPPQHGAGVHQWLFKVARQLHAHRDSETIVSLLTAVVEGCGRHVPEREIRAAVVEAEKCAWRPSGNTSTAWTPPPPPKWPAVDEAKRRGVIEAENFTLADLWDASPIACTRDSTDAEFFADELFPGNPLLCVGYSSQVFRTEPRESFRGSLHEMSLIVPSPMSAPVGVRKRDGKLSAHTLDNTGPRRFLVTEFDSGTPDEQVSIIHHLSGFAPLVLVLSSGGKSLHAWWRCWDASTDTQRKFFRYAVTLGADPATWTRSQFVRLPQGWRMDKNRHQEVFFFDHEAAEVKP
jgi:hypothetical protein